MKKSKENRPEMQNVQAQPTAPQAGVTNNEEAGRGSSGEAPCSAAASSENFDLGLAKWVRAVTREDTRQELLLRSQGNLSRQAQATPDKSFLSRLGLYLRRLLPFQAQRNSPLKPI